MKNRLSEGQTMRNFLLNEMDYYVPNSGEGDNEFIGDTEYDEFGYESSSIPDDHLDYDEFEDDYGQDRESYSDTQDRESYADYQDDEEESFYDDQPMDDPYFENKKRK